VRLGDGSLVSVQHGVRVHPITGETVFLTFSGVPVSTEPVSVAGGVPKQS